MEIEVTKHLNNMHKIRKEFCTKIKSDSTDQNKQIINLFIMQISDLNAYLQNDELTLEDFSNFMKLLTLDSLDLILSEMTEGQTAAYRSIMDMVIRNFS